MESEERSRSARARAEEALVQFAVLAGAHAQTFVVIGGLNPEYFVVDPPAEHQGTTDIDLLFSLGFDGPEPDADFSWIDTALSRGGFTTTNGWRWDATLQGNRVRIELLCDVWDHSGDAVPLPGAVHASATKLAGPAAAIPNAIVRELPVPPAIRAADASAPDRVTLRFPNLGGYILAKAAAAKSRMLPKDKYDLMYVMLYSEGGPQAAAAAVAAQLELVQDCTDRDELTWVVLKYCDPRGKWAGVFADVMRQTGAPDSEAQLRNDAAIGARAFLNALGMKLDEV